MDRAFIGSSHTNKTPEHVGGAAFAKQMLAIMTKLPNRHTVLNELRACR